MARSHWPAGWPDHPFSPHTRGWPRWRNRGKPCGLRSPRTRGDGPLSAALAVPAVPVLPAHAGMARPDATAAPARGRVLPAHAGMARPHRWKGCGSGCVLPAHAGMARSPRRKPQRPTSFSPHTRGWPVAAEGDAFCREGFSPHTRGWPAERVAACLEQTAFSPHTRGWPGLEGAPQDLYMRSPRTRGDGPATRGVRIGPIFVLPAHAGMARPSARSHSLCRLFSPHKRGWPAASGRQDSGVDVLPAHAEMSLLVASLVWPPEREGAHQQTKRIWWIAPREGRMEQRSTQPDGQISASFARLQRLR
jgi:hypothetical protein